MNRTAAYHAEEVQSLEDLVAWSRLRRDAYLAAGLLTQQDLSDGEYRDEYEARSRHVVLRDESGEAVGCVRLIIRAGAEAPLQVEEQFGLAVPARSAEISGFAVNRNHRDPMATLVLIRSVVELAKEERIDDVYCEVESWFLDMLTRAGFPVVVVTEPRHVFNTWNVVAHVSIGAFLRGVEQGAAQGDSSPLVRIFSHPWSWAGDEAVVPDQRGPALENA